MTESDHIRQTARAWRRAPRQLVLDRVPPPTEVQRRLARSDHRFASGVVDPDTFARELAAEYQRRGRGHADGVVGSVSIFEIPGIEERLGAGHLFDLITDVTEVFVKHLASTDIVNISEDGEILVLIRETPVKTAIRRIDRASRALASRYFTVDRERRLLTPSAGVATLDNGHDAADVIRRAIDAREVAAGHLDLRVHRWEPAMSSDTAPDERAPFSRFGWPTLKERLRAPVQILATYVLGLVVPFGIYWFFDQVVGFDITWGVYLFCVATLVTTGAMIVVEAQLAVNQREPPPVDEYPLATAIICAYLPNEASTILETIHCFLDNGYEGGLQIILAYNSPTVLPVEHELHALADAHPNLDIVRVEGSTSKAQNVNAVLNMARGEFTGMFDADHMPRPGSFERAWRWIADGYSVVQGHCLTRNGDETWLARMVAVEFESIYAVAHPGRARLHRFGVFGGSNGYWRTDLLHETRMRGSMLTEDIDSSMRTVERGLKIRSDRSIVSRELGTTTFPQVWNQRLRWAQGWWQVTLLHTVRVWRSPALSFRQKFGATYLLGWREVYPWLSLQVFPLVAYWLSRGDQLSTGFPVFLCTTLFVLHIGPLQTWFAYRLADDEIKQNKNWFWGYLFFSTLFYTEYKNTIARVAHIKEFVGERAWKVTPRSSDGEGLDASADVPAGPAGVAVPADVPAEPADAAADVPAEPVDVPADVAADVPAEPVDVPAEPVGAAERAEPTGAAEPADVPAEPVEPSGREPDPPNGAVAEPGAAVESAWLLPQRVRGASLRSLYRVDEALIGERLRDFAAGPPSGDRSDVAPEASPWGRLARPGRPLTGVVSMAVSAELMRRLADGSPAPPARPDTRADQELELVHVEAGYHIEGAATPAPAAGGD